jgi:hypothetical protein
VDSSSVSVGIAMKQGTCPSKRLARSSNSRYACKVKMDRVNWTKRNKIYGTEE